MISRIAERGIAAARCEALRTGASGGGRLLTTIPRKFCWTFPVTVWTIASVSSLVCTNISPFSLPGIEIVLQLLPMQSDTFIVIGSGIAGASAAYELAKLGSVIILERESQPGYHTTGRSAAVFSEIYGNAIIRGLTVGSRQFFTSPPAGFCEYPLWKQRRTVMIARSDQLTN